MCGISVCCGNRIMVRDGVGNFRPADINEQNLVI